MAFVDRNFWYNRRVFVTGHTGFKGAWFSSMLRHMGAVVTGYALAPSTDPSLHELLGHDDDTIADISDLERLRASLQEAAPEIVFHLAAQALVRDSYVDPVGTYRTNVLGTAALLEAIRATTSVRAVICVTSDKCYRNEGWSWGYRETDALGGHDPYSASKAASEIVVSSMRDSFFSGIAIDPHPARIASARAGNVIGGGDWSANRLVPDIVRAVGSGKLTLRYPAATRPWQHVLDCVYAYTGLAERLIDEEGAALDAFNFGPEDESTRTVGDLSRCIAERLGDVTIQHETGVQSLHEADLLRLDCSKARQELGWRPVWGFEQAIEATADWYVAFLSGANAPGLTRTQIDRFLDDAERT